MSADKPSVSEMRKAKRMAGKIISHFFGKAATRIRYLPGGHSNFVFLALHTEGHFVVRIGLEANKISAFIKEQWAIGKVRKLGVPTAQVLEVGSEIIPYPYMILERVAGKEARLHPERKPILHEMGHYAALINSVRTEGFGETFDWSSNQLSLNKTWSEYLKNELRLTHRLNIFKERGMISPQVLSKLKRVLLGPSEKTKPALNHGDLRLKNVIVDNKGKIKAIVDWEHCLSNMTPEWELSLALHDLSIDEKQEFLKGYGLSDKKIEQLSSLIKALNLINYAPVIEQLVKSKETTKLKQYRLRLSGALDLYTL